MKNAETEKNIFSLVKLAMISIMIPVCIHLFFKSKMEQTGVVEKTSKSFVEEDVEKLKIEQNIDKLVESIEELINLNTILYDMIKNTSIESSEIEILNESEGTEPIEVKWLSSPVTQAWEFDVKKQVWSTVLPFKDSMRSSPTLVIGLREDGLVVWREIKKQKSQEKF